MIFNDVKTMIAQEFTKYRSQKKRKAPSSWFVITDDEGRVKRSKGILRFKPDDDEGLIKRVKK